MNEPVFERTTRISLSEIPTALIEDLRKLHGVPPYNSWSNICYGDGYFSADIQRRFAADLIQAAMELIINPQLQQLRAASDAIAQSHGPQACPDWQQAYQQLRLATAAYLAAMQSEGRPGSGFDTRAATPEYNRRMASAAKTLGDTLAQLPAVEGEGAVQAPAATRCPSCGCDISRWLQNHRGDCPHLPL